MYIEKEVLLDDTHVGGTVVVARPLVEHHAAPGGLSQDPSLPTPPGPPDRATLVSFSHDAPNTQPLPGACLGPTLEGTLETRGPDQHTPTLGSGAESSRVSADDQPHTRAERGWLRLTAMLVVAEAAGSLPSVGRSRAGVGAGAGAVDRTTASGAGSVDGEGGAAVVDPDFLYAPCNGHRNRWSEAVCPCQDYLGWGNSPTWLLGWGRDPHDWVNCNDPHSSHLGHDTESCCDHESAEDDVVPRAQAPHWWRWPARFRRYLRHGVRLPWVEGVRPPPFRQGNYDTAADESVYREFARLRGLGHLDGPFAVGDRMHVVVTQPIGAVSKKDSDKKRVIVDFSVSKTNDHLPAWSFSLPRVQDVLDHIRRPGMYGSSLDLKDAFLHIPTHPSDRPYWAVDDPTPPGWRPDEEDDEAVLAGYRVTEEGRSVYRYASTGFGCKLSPYFFCKPIQFVVETLQDFGIPWEEYVDDAVILGDSPRQVMARVEMVRAAWAFLGLQENESKFESPSTCFTFLGLEIDTVAMVVRYPAKKRDKLLAKMEDFRERYGADGVSVPRKELASIVGKIGFAANGVRGGRIYTRRLYQALHTHIDHLTLQQRLHLTGSVKCLDPSFWADWDWWLAILPTLPANGKRFFVDKRSNLQHVWGDASKAGHGATWLSPSGDRSISRAWEEEMRQASSNLRELCTFEEALEEWGDEWPTHSRVLYSTDNTATAAALNTGYANSDQMMTVVRRVHAWAAVRDITILSRWVPGWRIIAHGEDGLSRADNFKAPIHVPWVLDAATDAHWAHLGGDAARMPTFGALDSTIRRALEAYEDDPERNATTLIIPDWPTASFYPLLRRFRPWHRYEAGASVLRRPGAPDDVVHTRHPLLVLRLPRLHEAGLSRSQRRRSRESAGGGIQGESE